MKLIFSNYVLAILVLFFFKIALVDQVRAGFRGNGDVERAPAQMQTNTRLTAIR